MKLRWILACLVAIGAMSYAALSLRGTVTNASDSDTAAQLSIVSPVRKPLRDVVQCTGRVVSNRDVEIKSKASGQVIQLPFDVSDHVTQGDLLIEIDPTEQLRNVQRAEAALAVSKARLAQAESNLAVAQLSLVSDRRSLAAEVKSAQARAADARSKAGREWALREKKQSSVEEAETAETTAVEAEQQAETALARLDALRAQEKQLDSQREDINLNRAQLQSDEVSLALQRQYLSETKIVAPISGVVSEKTVQTGQIISSGISNVGGGTAVLMISDLSQIFILGAVDESDIGRVRLDQAATITADAFPRVTFAGKVVRVATKGVNVSNVVTFEVKMEVTSENKSLLRPEMTANVDIVISETADALTVPVGAVLHEADGDYVTIAGGAEPRRVAVQTGISDGTDIEIVAGVTETDAVQWREEDEDSQWRQQQGGFGPPPPM